MNIQDSNLIDDFNLSLEEKGTGDHEELQEYRKVSIPFDRYFITVKLSATNEFLGITEVRINKQFRSFKEKQPKGYHDVDEFYRE